MVNRVDSYRLTSGYNNIQFRGNNTTSTGFKKLSYEEKVNQEESNIENIIEKSKDPLKIPTEKPILTTTGPDGGEFKQYPQRANGTHYTIETLKNGDTKERTYSESGLLLNEVQRTKLNTQITTYNGDYTDSVILTPMQGTMVTGKIQAGNLIKNHPPKLSEITEKK